MFIAALFTITKTQKQPKGLLTEEGIKKIWYKHTMEYYATLKKTKILSHGTVWMNLEDIMLSEISHSQTYKCCMISLI